MLEEEIMHVSLKKPSIVLMLSGGLDSVGALYALLTNSEYKDFHIHVHHISIINNENRHIAESNAVTNIIKWFTANNYKPFEYSKSVIGIPAFNHSALWDTDITSFVAGFISNSSYNVHHIAFGVTKDDFVSLLKSKRSADIYDAFIPFASKIFPLQLLTKQNVYDMMPKELTNLSWSCRTPILDENVFKKCGKCSTCMAIKQLKTD